jgi:hypothetical protein
VKNNTCSKASAALVLSVIFIFGLLLASSVSAQECSGVLECAEERAGQEPEASLSDVLCESYQKLGITAADVPAAIQNCEQYRHVLPLLQKIDSPEAHSLYRQLSGAIEDSGLSGSVESLMEKAEELDTHGYLKQLLPNKD